ncbi:MULTISPECIES: PAS domain S-box protein [Brevundimonas]|uniref:PAS domain S-box protein n=1 Tax=Brevundimonas TaxID=41275 RepID=UPI00069126B8|nr:PAS domain S-box protein [Brevundimonas nasdae]
MSPRGDDHTADAEAVAASQERLERIMGPTFGALTRIGAPLTVADAGLPDTPIILANAAFSQLTGYSARETIGRNCRFLQGAQTDDDAVRRMREAISTGQDCVVDLLNVRKDGSLFWNRVSLTLIEGEGARYILGSQADVTSEHGRDRVSGAGGVWEWDIPAGRLYADARFAEIYGLDARDAFVGVPTSAFFGSVYAEDRLRVRVAVAGVLHGAEVFSKTYRVVRDTSLVWVSARGRLELDEDGQPARFSGVLTDISDQMRLEQQLRVAQTAGGVGSFEYISGFGTADVSAQFCRLLGFDATDTLSIRAINAVVGAGGAPIIAAGDLPQSLSPYKEFRIRRVDTGEERWVARRGELTPDSGEAGVRFIGVIYDITAAKRAEAELKAFAQTLEDRVEERTRERDRLWSLSRDLFFLCDADGIATAVNPAWTETLGCDAAAMIGASFESLVHPDDVEAARRFIAETAAGGVHDVDCRVRRLDDGYAWINWTGIGEDGAVFAIGRDVTQRRQLEDQLRQSQKMEAVGQLTGGLAHDFNNMLTGIMGGMDIIRRRIAENRLDDVERFLASAMTSAERAAALTHRLLAFSRRQSLDVRAVDVNDLVLSMEDLLRRTLGERVTVQVQVDPAVGAAATDPSQLESAILNLAINARDAMPDGGALTITTQAYRQSGPDSGRFDGLAEGDYILLTVADTGEGMPPEVLAKAFDPFFTTKPIGQGTGLGLSMIYGFMHQTGGHAEIASRPGEGAAVTLCLARAAYVRPQERQSEPVSAPSAEGKAVLVVEDDPSVRILVVEVLEELGYHTFEAPNAPTALHILHDTVIDLLITDVGLPGMDGRDLAEAATRRDDGLRVLFMTGYAEKAAIQSEFLGPRMAMITKPFTIDAFMDRIRQVFGPG